MAPFDFPLLLFHSMIILLALLSCSQVQVKGQDSTVSSNATVNCGHRPKWVGPRGHHTIKVNANGSAHFTSVQAAVDSIQENNTMNVTIKISAGCYMYYVIIFLRSY